MSQPLTLMLIGGFLGAGKTTLLARLSEALITQGHRIGLVTNDQAANLVDTGLLSAAGLPVSEVAGGCFCCRFDALLESLDALQKNNLPDTILAEPVGSCTDLSATILQPIKKFYADRFSLSPLAVVVDPIRLWHIFRGDFDRPFPESIFYIFEKQIEESDLIILNKCDILPVAELDHLEERLKSRFPGKKVFRVSALTGQGIDALLGELLSGNPSGQRTLDIDYDLYAQGEAELGWLNSSLQIDSLTGPLDWQSLLSVFMNQFQSHCVQAGAQIAHAKAQLTSHGFGLQANLVSNDSELSMRVFSGKPTPQNHCAIIFNARVHIAPETLRTIFEKSMGQTFDGKALFEIKALDSFRPSRPVPIHRLTRTE